MGGAIGVAILYILTAVLVVFAPFGESDKAMTEINSSDLVSKLCEDNVIVEFLSKGE